MMKIQIKGPEMPKGGAREGAGRPTKMDKEGVPAKVFLGCRVEKETMDKLQAEKGRSNKSLGELVDDLAKKLEP